MVFLIDIVLTFFLENDGVVAAQENEQDIETISNTGTMKLIFFHFKQYSVTQKKCSLVLAR